EVKQLQAVRAPMACSHVRLYDLMTGIAGQEFGDAIDCKLPNGATAQCVFQYVEGRDGSGYQGNQGNQNVSTQEVPLCFHQKSTSCSRFALVGNLRFLGTVLAACSASSTTR